MGNSIEKDEEILNNIKTYMQENIDKGWHKFVYNDLGCHEKCIDIINAIETVLSELEKKDKIIDLMAEFINKFDLDESICKDIKCNNDVTKQDCINCIKKYFFDTKKNIF